jgi:hypothetical protein
MPRLVCQRLRIGIKPSDRSRVDGHSLDRRQSGNYAPKRYRMSALGTHHTDGVWLTDGQSDLKAKSSPTDIPIAATCAG